MAMNLLEVARFFVSRQGLASWACSLFVPTNVEQAWVVFCGISGVTDCLRDFSLEQPSAWTAF